MGLEHIYTTQIGRIVLLIAILSGTYLLIKEYNRMTIDTPKAKIMKEN